MGKGFILGRTDLCMREIGDRIKFMELEHTTGWMVVLIKVSGKRDRCMESDFTPGKIQSNTKVNTSTTRKRAMGSTHGLMGESTRVTGRMENNTGSVN